jgi:hypothetical protein
MNTAATTPKTASKPRMAGVDRSKQAKASNGSADSDAAHHEAIDAEHSHGRNSRKATEELNAEEKDAALLAKLEGRRFDIANRPDKPIPIIQMDGALIASVGNIQVLQGKVKQGKTGVVTALLAAAMQPGEEHLGFTVSDSRGRVVLHFDTEQSRFDHDNVVRTALRRAGLSAPPPWLHSYCVTDFTLSERREAFFAACARARGSGGLHLALLDGVADLVTSPNEEAEAIALCDRIHQAAMQCEAAILSTLHENPGSEIGKTRGHLGSQLERKAETNLRLEKDGDGVTVIFTDRARHCNITKDTGSRFRWGDDAQMHVSAPSGQSAKSTARITSLNETAEEAFRDADAGGMRRCDLLAAIAKADGLKPGGARDRFDRLREAGIITKTADDRWRMKL